MRRRLPESWRARGPEQAHRWIGKGDTSVVNEWGDTHVAVRAELQLTKMGRLQADPFQPGLAAAHPGMIVVALASCAATVGVLAKKGIPVTLTCRVLGFSKQAFYKWQANPVTDRDWHDAHLINAALDIHADDPAFGYRFIADQLAEVGIAASENRVQRVCQQQRIWSVFAKKRGLSRRAGPPVHDDLVDREFTAPIVIWIERTYHRRRRQRGLGRLTPIEYLKHCTRPLTQPESSQSFRSRIASSTTAC